MSKSRERIIEEQIKKWESKRPEEREKKPYTPIITVCREPGSGGRIVAKRIAEQLGLEFFDREIIQEMAENTHVTLRLLETLDEKGLTVLDDWIATLVFKRHLWPNQYLKSLMKVISTIGRHGRDVILGRGANFILCPECPDVSFRVRIVAPLKMRVQNVARDFDIEAEEAKRRVLRTESNRRAFVRKYFHADITDPYNYDLVINIQTLSVDAAAEAIKGALGR